MKTLNYEALSQCHPSLARGRVWCHACGSSMNVDPAKCLRSGWPLCCGQTMSIDSPDERKALANLRQLRGACVGALTEAGIYMLETEPCAPGEVSRAIKRLAGRGWSRLPRFLAARGGSGTHGATMPSRSGQRRLGLVNRLLNRDRDAVLAAATPLVPDVPAMTVEVLLRLSSVVSAALAERRLT